LENYKDISLNWGGGYTVIGEDSFRILGKRNALLSKTIDVKLDFDGVEFDVNFVTDELPEGFTLSTDGVISGSSTVNVIGKYYVDIVRNNIIIKTVSVNFRITPNDMTIADVGDIGFKLGNKFIKIVV
jgi:hypothetical protein